MKIETAITNKQEADDYIQRTFRALYAVLNACDDADVCPLCQEDIGSGAVHGRLPNGIACPVPPALKAMEVDGE